MMTTAKQESPTARRLDPRRIEVVDDDLAAILRTKTPMEKVEMVLAANRLLRQRISGHLKTHHPDWSGEQIASEVTRRMLGGTG